jgi:hypothetical protein
LQVVVAVETLQVDTAVAVVLVVFVLPLLQLVVVEV